TMSVHMDSLSHAQYLFFFYRYCHHRDLHSFPTRRSSDLGYEVGEAEDGPEGLRLFGNGSKWDAVVLDQRMPGMDGLETLRQLKRSEEHTSELQSQSNLVCRLLLEKKKKNKKKQQKKK